MSSPPLLEPKCPSREDLEAFIARHKHLLELERDAEEEQTRLLNSNCSPRLLEKRGLALGGLGVASVSIGLGGKSLVELHRPLAYHIDPVLPPHTFRSGDPVRIDEHVASTNTKGKAKARKVEDDNAVEGVVYRVSADKVVVAVSEGKDIDLPERLRLLKLANTVTFDRMDRTLNHLSRLLVPNANAPGPSNVGNWSLINSLVGLQQPAWSKTIRLPTATSTLDTITERHDEEIKWYSEGLNDSQKEAIVFCLKANDIACIHGPPGTGKTHTLIELIFQFLSRSASNDTTLPPRILVTTPSNLALDNLLLRLHALSLMPAYAGLLPRGSILRLGHPTRVHRDLVRETLDWRAANGEDGGLVRDVGREIEGHLNDLSKKRGEKGAVKGRDRGKKWDEVRELRKEYRQREAKVVVNVVKSARVVLATCHSAGSRQINNMEFDIAIVDEATQAVEAVCWVPILKSKKLILAGDPQQLPPTILSKGEKKLKRTKTNKENSTAKVEVTEVYNTPLEDRSRDDIVEVTTPLNEKETELSDGDGGDLVASLDDMDMAKKQTTLRPPRSLETTLFDRLERLYGTGIKRVLKVQYRMNEHIAAFPSATLYDSELISAPSVAKHTLLDLPTISDRNSDDAKDALEPTVIFFDTAGCEFYERNEGDGDSESKPTKAIGEGSKSNENEAAVVAKWARRLVSLGVPPAEVGIVTPYQAQVSLIAGMLREEFPDMTIGSVDGLQGQERDAIIVSLVRSNPTGEVGFLGEYRRLNVAMTRPRRQLCVVGDSETVGKGSSYLKKWMSWLDEEADVRWAGDEVA